MVLNKFKQLQSLLRFVRLKLNKRIQFNGFVSMGENVQIILEQESKLIFRGRCSLKAGTVIYVKKSAVLIFGGNTSTGHDTEISVSKLVQIGDDVIMGAYTYISDSNHRFDSPNIKIREQGMDIGSVEIGSDVWIGRGAMILKDARIGNRTVVGAGAIVTKQFGDGVVIGGAPGRVLKELM